MGPDLKTQLIVCAIAWIFLSIVFGVGIALGEKQNYEESKLPPAEQRKLREERRLWAERDHARTVAAMRDVKSTLSLGAVMLAAEITKSPTYRKK